jgi:hypothetical protein
MAPQDGSGKDPFDPTAQSRREPREPPSTTPPPPKKARWRIAITILLIAIVFACTGDLFLFFLPRTEQVNVHRDPNVAAEDQLSAKIHVLEQREAQLRKQGTDTSKLQVEIQRLRKERNRLLDQGRVRPPGTVSWPLSMVVDLLAALSLFFFMGKRNSSLADEVESTSSKRGCGVTY